MSSFVTRDETISRHASRHASEMARAVDAINKLIRTSEALPIDIPIDVFPKTDCVRHEVIRQLRESSGWKVSKMCGDVDTPTLSPTDEGITTIRLS